MFIWITAWQWITWLLCWVLEGWFRSRLLWSRFDVSPTWWKFQPPARWLFCTLSDPSSWLRPWIRFVWFQCELSKCRLRKWFKTKLNISTGTMYGHLRKRISALQSAWMEHCSLVRPVFLKSVWLFVVCRSIGLTMKTSPLALRYEA